MHQATADADTMIIRTAVELAQHTNVVVIGEDTDLLVLLCFHARSAPCETFLRSDQGVAGRGELLRIKELRHKLGDEVCDGILFGHALLGCDTTSGLFGIGKAHAVDALKQKKVFRDCAAEFMKPSASKEEIGGAGERALVCVYGGKPHQSLNDLRYHRFCMRVASSKAEVTPQSLPPTSAAAHYHSLRVYCQVH